MSSKLNEWSLEEKELLCKNFPKIGSDCSKYINRTKRACQEMAKKLGLKKIYIYEDKQKFEELVKSCSSYKECVIKLGLSPRCSGNFQTIKKYIKLYNLDIYHILK